MDDKPVQYERGWVEFYKLRLKVTPDVLIPRSETELLVDYVLSLNPKTVLDIGTGSGAIAVSIAKNIPDAKITATDISKKALEIAKQNAKFHQIGEKITFLHADLLNVIARTPIYIGGRGNPTERDCFAIARNDRGDRNDDDVSDISPHQVIVTNLPYIPSARIPYLDPSVKDFEPYIALDGGEDGFKLYRRLFLQIIQKNLYPKVLIGEIDYTHGLIAKATALKYFPKAEVQVKTDLAHKQRILIIRY